MSPNPVISDFVARCVEKGDATSPCVLRVRVGGTSRSATDASQHELSAPWDEEVLEEHLDEVLEELPAGQRAYIDARTIGATSSFARCVVEPATTLPRHGERVGEARMAGSLAQVITALLQSLERKEVMNQRLVKSVIDAGGVAAIATARLELAQSENDSAYFREVAQLVAPMLGPVATKLLTGSSKQPPTAKNGTDKPRDPGETWDKGILILAGLARAHPEILTPERKAIVVQMLTELAR